MTWSLKGEPDARALTLRWEETGGPTVDGKSSTGFGTKVLEQLTPAALSGEASVERKASGLVWELTAPQSGFDGT